MGTPFHRVSGDAQRALEDFSTQFDAALAAVDPETQWGNQLGLYHPSNAIKTTYPIPVSAAGYKERDGDDTLRRLMARSLSMSPRRWYDGIEEFSDVIEAPDFIGWTTEPANIAKEGMRHNNRLVAEMLEANLNLDFYRDETLGTDLGIPLFSDSHPVNIFETALGTFDNDHTAAAIDSDMFQEVKTRFRKKKAANGQVMGLRFDGLLVPASREEETKSFLESDNLILTVQNAAKTENVGGTWTNNRHKNTVTMMVADELTDDDVVYAFSLSSGAFPWVIQDDGSPEEIRYDKDSDYWKDTGKIAIKYIRRAAAKAALPHAIERITLTG